MVFADVMSMPLVQYFVISYDDFTNGTFGRLYSLSGVVPCLLPSEILFDECSHHRTHDQHRHQQQVRCLVSVPASDAGDRLLQTTSFYPVLERKHDTDKSLVLQIGLKSILKID